MMNEFKKPWGAELEENQRAIRAMWMLGWFLLSALLCGAFYFGLYFGWIAFGGR